MSTESEIDNKIRKIIIVGGGSSGWMCASYLSKALNFDVEIVLIESAKIGRIGVGEATIPSLKEVLFDFLEIPEDRWMPICTATYKMGIRYENWNKSIREGQDHYYHLFGEMPVYKGIPLAQIWMSQPQQINKKGLAYACYPAALLADHLKSPRFLNREKAVHYAYHVDANKLADFLKEWSAERGVKCIEDDIVHVALGTDGKIGELIGSDGAKYMADLFIDCSGFAGILIEKALKEPWTSYADSLLTDSAIAVNVPGANGKEGIRPYTTATALDNGWLWQIPLFNRTGNGYVFSSAFTSAENAEKEIRGFFGNKVEGLDIRQIKFRSGRRKRSWVKNCVSFGLASSFLEPLESTGLYFVYAALYQFVQYFPDKKFDPILQKKFNERISYMVEDVRDFIIMHFCTSPRTDTAYWKANKYELVIPDSLKEILELQKAGIPIRKGFTDNSTLYSSFESSFERFWTNSNFQSVFAGVGYLPEATMPLLTHRKDIYAEGSSLFDQIEEEGNKLLKELPSHFEYLDRQRQMSLQGTLSTI